MTSRILVADDSLTIQKVIGITLANTGFELVECLNEEELLKKIQSNHFDLVLLDFNLSDSRSGYELAKQISNAIPGVGIIVMLGTFDTIDESQFSGSGISDKIVKPFESSKFIKKCRDLLEGNRPTPAPLEEKIVSAPVEEKSDDLDLWTVDAPSMTSKFSAEEPATPAYGAETKNENLDPLLSEIEGWGFKPNNYLEEKFQKSFPPAIEEDSNYSKDDGIIERLQSSSNFVQNTKEEMGIDNDETDPTFEMPYVLKRDLLTEINDEISAEAFWAVDEIVPIKAEEYKDIVDTNLEEVTADLTDTIQFFKENEAKSEMKSEKKTSKTEESDSIIHMDQDELVEKLKISLRPMIEEMVREFCRQNAEKVAWEVIPDLAENLIRKEIKEISESVQH